MPLSPAAPSSIAARLQTALCRSGDGSIMAQKNLIAIVAQTPDIHRDKSTAL